MVTISTLTDIETIPFLPPIVPSMLRTHELHVMPSIDMTQVCWLEDVPAGSQGDGKTASNPMSSICVRNNSGFVWDGLYIIVPFFSSKLT